MPDEPNAQLTSSYTSSSTAGSTAGDAGADFAVADSGSGEATLPSVVRESHAGQAAQRHPDPTRYGDWEKGGRCIDF